MLAWSKYGMPWDNRARGRDCIVSLERVTHTPMVQYGMPWVTRGDNVLCWQGVQWRKLSTPPTWVQTGIMVCGVPPGWSGAILTIMGTNNRTPSAELSEPWQRS